MWEYRQISSSHCHKHKAFGKHSSTLCTCCMYLPCLTVTSFILPIGTQVLTAVTIKSSSVVSKDHIICIIRVETRNRQWHLHLAGLLLGLLLALKMEAICCSSKMSVDLYNTIQHGIPKDGTLLFVQLKEVVVAVLLKTFKWSKNYAPCHLMALKCHTILILCWKMDP
jgi:hypothetical protein